MNQWSKFNGKIKMNLLQILLKSILLIGLSACNSPASQSYNVSEKSDKAMLNEIYDSKIKPDHFLKIQENNTRVTSIVLKYFKIGENRSEIVVKLARMKIESNKKSDGRIVAFAIKGNNPLFSKDDDKTVEIAFEFDSGSKLINIQSRYFRRQ